MVFKFNVISSFLILSMITLIYVNGVNSSQCTEEYKGFLANSEYQTHFNLMMTKFNKCGSRCIDMKTKNGVLHIEGTGWEINQAKASCEKLGGYFCPLNLNYRVGNHAMHGKKLIYSCIPTVCKTNRHMESLLRLYKGMSKERLIQCLDSDTCELQANFCNLKYSKKSTRRYLTPDNNGNTAIVLNKSQNENQCSVSYDGFLKNQKYKDSHDKMMKDFGACGNNCIDINTVDGIMIIKGTNWKKDSSEAECKNLGGSFRPLNIHMNKNNFEMKGFNLIYSCIPKECSSNFDMELLLRKYDGVSKEKLISCLDSKECQFSATFGDLKFSKNNSKRC